MDHADPAMLPMIEIIPLTGIDEVTTGDDLGALLASAIDRVGLVLMAGDVVVVTQKIVSKAEGRMVSLADFHPSPRAIELAEITCKDAALVELVLRESTSVVRAVPNILITRHRLGFVMANAGIDRSNIGPGGGNRALLLPEDPDASAEAIATSLTRNDVTPAVVISDSFGRPWRMGVVAVGIGSAGLPALSDRRGQSDRDGRMLEVTQIAVADLLASAAALASGEGAESIPAVVIRGYAIQGSGRPASYLTRPLEEDLFQ